MRLSSSKFAVQNFTSINIFDPIKSNGSSSGNMDQGMTIFDAIRIIQNNDGLFIKLNDATFSRSDTNRNRVAKSTVTGH